MKKIEKYLKSIGYALLFSKMVRYQNNGGKSFYNDGTYQEEVFQIIGTPFIIHNKCTGRQLFTLYKGSKLVGLDFTQKRFIEEVLEKHIVNSILNNEAVEIPETPKNENLQNLPIIKHSRIFKEFFDSLGLEHEVKNIIEYLAIEFPMLFSFELEGKIFLSYVLKCKRIEKELDILTTEIPNYEEIAKMLNAQNSVFDMFDKGFTDNTFYYGMKKEYKDFRKVNLGDGVEYLFGMTEYHNQDYLVKDLLPAAEFNLTPITLNRIRLDEVKDKIETCIYK